jgi:hypothetical protein
VAWRGGVAWCVCVCVCVCLVESFSQAPCVCVVVVVAVVVVVVVVVANACTKVDFISHVCVLQKPFFRINKSAVPTWAKAVAEVRKGRCDHHHP